MGCCQSTAIKEHDRSRLEAPLLSDACYPDKVGHGGVKVLASSASLSGSGASSGRTHTRLIVGPDWIFAALFEAHGGGDWDSRGGGGSCCDTAARFCAEHCYAEFQRATEAARPAAAAAAAAPRSDESSVQNALAAALRALDGRFLSDDNIPPQERLTSGCTGVLLHVALGETPMSSTASLGPCSAVVGQRRGGLASATSAPLVLCGGAASSHDALQDFLAALAAEQRHQASSAPKGSARSLSSSSLKSGCKRKPSPASSSANMSLRLVGPTSAAAGGLEPAYSGSSAAPQALGFGCGKGLRLAARQGGAPAGEAPEASVGLQVQTASHALGPADDCVVLLSGGAAAGITPGDVVLLMHRMGRLAAIPYETKPRPLPLEAARGPVVQLDSLGVAGPPPAAPPATAPTAVAPFNAARLLVQHAVANAASRGANASVGQPAGVMAFSLEWPRNNDDSAAAAAASGASVSAVRAAAAAAASSRRRAQYRWQLLRLYYKFPYKRHLAIIGRWHLTFDRVMGNARALANQKETAAWKRLNAAVKVTPGGQVQCLSARDDRTAIPPAPVQQNRTPVPNASPLRGMSGTRQQGRSPLSAVGAGAATVSSYVSSPGGPAAVLAGGAGANPRSPISTRGSARQRTPNAGMNSARQRSPSPSLSGTPRCASARETRPSAAAAGSSAEDHAAQAAAAAARRNTMPASPSRPGAGAGPVGLLEAEGIEQRAASGQKLLRSEASASEGGRERAPIVSPSLADMASQRSVAASPAVAPAVAASKAIMNVPSSQSSPAETRVGEDGSEPGGEAPGGPPNAATAAAVVDAAATAAAPATEASPSVRKAASQRVADGLTVEGAGSSSTAPGSTTTAAAPTISSPAPATSPTVARAPAANATAPTRIPSLSAGGAPLSSRAGGDGAAAAAAAAGPPTNRARATMRYGTPRSSIPTLQLKPGPSAAAAAAGSATPRLSMPGGIPTQASAGGAAAASPTPTPPTRASNTWGGAPSATPATSASTVAPNSARSGSSRLPRPTNLSATMPAGMSSSGGGAAAPGASPVGSTTISRSLFASSEAGSAIRPASQRPPRLDVTSSTGGSSLAGAAALPTPGGDDAELFSPDADQLEAWAAEAVNAISASVTKKQPQTRSQQQTPPSSQRQDAGAISGRRKVTQSESWKSASLGRATDSGASGGGAKPAMGSRIPLSPRHPNSSSNANVDNSQAPSRTPSHGSISKAMRSPSSSSVGASGGVAASADYSAATPQRAASARSRR